MVEALNKPDLELPEHLVSVSDIQIRSPYHFQAKEFPDWQKVPGQTTIRFGNACFSLNNGGSKLFWSFNIWKYRKIDKSEKRKLEPENTTEPVPELAKRVCQENCEA